MSELYDQVFARNRAWVATMRARDPDFFTRLAAEQTPTFLYLGCADSRVPANVIMGLEPGDVFVHRNVANLVPSGDPNVQAVVHYAVQQLSVRHIVVCGHYGCGGIAAAQEQRDLGPLNGWLNHVRDVIRLHRDELEAISDPQARDQRLVELNVEEQCVNVLKIPCVQESLEHNGYPQVHGWVYDLGEGLLRDLELPFRELLASMQDVYGIGTGSGSGAD